MQDSPIKPENITTPFQLLAAWLVGLILTDSAFLAAATSIDHPRWAPGVLVVAAALNVPLFISALFLLQTKFRAEMQDDHHFSKYIESRYDREAYGSLQLNVSPDAMSKIKVATRAAQSEANTSNAFSIS